jgi:oleate hydratase
MRATVNRGEDAHTDGKFTLSEKAAMEIAELFMTKDEDLYDKKIENVFTEDFFASNFWLYWRTMFAFEEWHSALEMKLYIQRFIHHIKGLPDFSTLKFTKYNQYESLVMPMVKYLEDNGVQFQYDTQVTNVVFDIQVDKKVANKIVYNSGGKEAYIDLTEDDLVFVTNGSCTENASLGDHHHPAEINEGPGGCWELWRKIAAQDEAFGHPDKFCTNISETNWESATVTTLDNRIPPYIEKICKRDPFSGKVVTGGIITVKDSKWLMSYTLNRQPHFNAQPKDQLVVWVYALFTDVPGDYVKKPMRECTGLEITEEWLYHMGVPEAEIHEIAAESASTVPCMMPYITAFFMPRTKGDRPKVVPEGAVNFAFVGQFADTVRDTVFTTEYSVRTAMEAVYTLLEVDRGVPEVFASCFDVRTLLDSSARMMDGQKLTELKLPFILKMIEKGTLHKISGTVLEDLLKESNLI